LRGVKGRKKHAELKTIIAKFQSTRESIGKILARAEKGKTGRERSVDRLQKDFTTSYQRRGRGEGGKTQTLRREVLEICSPWVMGKVELFFNDGKGLPKKGRGGIRGKSHSTKKKRGG